MEIIKCALVIEYGGADCALLLLNLLLFDYYLSNKAC